MSEINISLLQNFRKFYLVEVIACSAFLAPATLVYTDLLAIEILARIWSIATLIVYAYFILSSKGVARVLVFVPILAAYYCITDVNVGLIVLILMVVAAFAQVVCINANSRIKYQCKIWHSQSAPGLSLHTL